VTQIFAVKRSSLWLPPFPSVFTQGGSKFKFFCYKWTKFDDIANELHARMRIDRYDLKRRGLTRTNGKRGPILNKSVNRSYVLSSSRNIANPLSRCQKSRLINMPGAWKTYCVLLLCVSTLKVLATDDTSSQKDEEPKMTDEEINEELTKTMG